MQGIKKEADGPEGGNFNGPWLPVGGTKGRTRAELPKAFHETLRTHMLRGIVEVNDAVDTIPQSGPFGDHASEHDDPSEKIIARGSVSARSGKMPKIMLLHFLAECGATVLATAETSLHNTVSLAQVASQPYRPLVKAPPRTNRAF